MARAIVSIVDDEADVRASVQGLLVPAGFDVWPFASARAVLDCPMLSQSRCLIADVDLPDMDGLSLQDELARRQIRLPLIVVTGNGNAALAVRAMRAGAVDFLEKPFSGELLIHSVRRALLQSTEAHSQATSTQAAKDRIDRLTEREHQVLVHLIAGQSNKVIAYELDISPRTVEVYRARLMHKMEAGSLAHLVRLATEAGFSPRT